MKAARYYGYKDIRIEDVPTPETPKGFVRIRVSWAGICGTDRHEYVGPLWYLLTNLIVLPASSADYPRTRIVGCDC